MPKLISITGFVLCLSLCPAGSGATRYVDGSVARSGNGDSYQTAVKTIQEGIDAASDGDTVMVAQGTYLENVHFSGKNITLTSTDPSDWDVVANTIIDGNQAGSVVTFSGSEGNGCTLSGFTIRSGSANYGGGIAGQSTAATITDNVITSNSAHNGAGLSNCSGTIRDNVITRNWSEYQGAGLSTCDGTIQNNIIIRNWSDYEGGGLYNCNGTIRDNIITGNSAHGGGGLHDCDGFIVGNTITRNVADNRGGGISECDGTVKNNVITGNISDYQGGGLYECIGIIENNTIAENLADYQGGGLADCTATIVNCIIWGNLSPSGQQLYESSAPSYSCIEDWQDGGVGNMSVFPRFVNAGGEDYRLWSWSPCVDAGDPSSDFSNEPQPNGGRINMGAYGNTPEAASTSRNTDKDLLPDDWEMYFFGDLDEGPNDDPDGDGRSNFEEYQDGTNPTWAGMWYVDGSVAASGDGKSRETAFKRIQEGIDAAFHGDTVVVAEGTYVENLRFEGKNITLTSAEPLDSEVVANTIIEGEGFTSVIIFLGTEDETCVLSGFTVRNGSAHEGGGIAGHGTLATIQHNVIVENWAEGCGGGLHDCDGVIRNNVVVDNSARDPHQGGGGLAYCDGTILNNTIVSNQAIEAGGGLYDCDGIIINCILWENTANRDPQLYASGGATYCCIQGREGPGEGNTSAYPHFVDAFGGDYHLVSWSPCIDAGDPSSDYFLEPAPSGGRINMGAYGNTPEAASASPDTDGDDLPDDWEMKWFGDLDQGANDDPDEDNVFNIQEYKLGTDPGGLNSDLWYVDGSMAVSGDGTSWDTAFKTIQEGIDASFHGDKVIVAQGTYVENIEFEGRNITLTSTDPLDPAVVNTTIIDGNQAGAVVTFYGSELETCVLSGFTIQNGWGSCGGGISGGVEHWYGQVHSSPTIEHNVIVGNIAGWESDHGAGGGIYGCNGLIQNNLIAGNTAVASGSVGGGLAECDGIIQNNFIINNFGTFGGGMSWCDGIVQNNLIAENSCEPHGHGGGLYRCNGIVRNNTIAMNVANWGGGLDFSEGIILNCIIWGNTASLGPQMNRSSTPNASCIQNWAGGGQGNISDNPLFVSPGTGDYHLASGSLCINQGWNEPWMWEAVDLDGRPRILDGQVDIGAYEQAHFGPWYVDCDVPVSGDGRSWPTAFQTIQEGIDAAGEGDEVIVAEGTYAENIVFLGRDIILHSTDPNDPKVVASTIIIDGGANMSVVRFTGTETPECLLLGFTIVNGSADYGGGICGGTQDKHTHATIRNNTITGNRATYDGGGIAFCDGLLDNNVISENLAEGNGGGLYDCQGTIHDNVIRDNVAAYNGGGLYRCDGTIENNALSGNEASEDGGGLYDCQGTIRNNTVTDNAAVYSGGGFCSCHGLIEKNIISLNSAARGGGLDYCGGMIQFNVITGNSVTYGGGGLAWCEGTVQNNVIRGNSAYYGGGLAWGTGTIQNNLIVANWGDDRGGGLEGCNGAVRNNTIVGNAASDRGGGLADCDATITNCVIWGNTAAYSAQLSVCSSPTYCCIEEWEEGEGNFSSSPRFMDADGPDDNPDAYEDNDYRLAGGSACIDVGKNESWMWRTVDMDGKLRILFGIFSLTVDVGAYEYGAASFRILDISRTDSGGLELMWKSRHEEHYMVWSCYDLESGDWTRAFKGSILSAGEITTWTDTGASSPWKFYRVEVLQ